MAEDSEDITQHSPLAGRRIIIAVVVFVLVLAIAFFIVHRRKAFAEEALIDQTAKTVSTAPVVTVVTVNMSPASQAMVLPGATAAWYQSTVYARVDGYVRDWKRDIGDKVERDELLADIDTPELDANLAAARAKLAAGEAEVKVAQANADFAKSTYDRWWQSPKGVVSEQERQEKKAEYDSSLAKLESAKADITLEQAEVDRYTAFEKYKAVTAPFHGVVTARRIDIGDLVTAGSTANTTSLYTIAQSDEIRVFVDVPQRASPGMDAGLAADVTTDEFPGRVFSGKIARSTESIDPASRTLHVEVDVPNKDLTLVPGMYVEVHFQLKALPAAVVPAAAMLFRANGPQVAVVDPDNKVEFKSVTIARDHGDLLDIASGINDGDRVVLNISSDIAEGDVVDPQTDNAETPNAPAHPAPVATADPDALATSQLPPPEKAK